MPVFTIGLLLIQAQPLFSRDDYPAEALRKRQEGTVEVDILVTKEGRVGACQVVVSSGSPSLDQGTCDLIMRRARYTPATDDQGDPIEGKDHTKVRWKIPSR